jgi:hypothetical protein
MDEVWKIFINWNHFASEYFYHWVLWIKGPENKLNNPLGEEEWHLEYINV